MQGSDEASPNVPFQETLKYLFLHLGWLVSVIRTPISNLLLEVARLFSDDAALPLDQFVLGTEAHPLPILHTLEQNGDLDKLRGTVAYEA